MGVSVLLIKQNHFVLFLMTSLALLTVSFPFAAYIRLGVVGLIGVLTLLFHVSRAKDIQSRYFFFYVGFMLWGALSILWVSSFQGYREQILNMVISITSNIVIATYCSSENETFETTLKWLVPVMLIYLVGSIMVGNLNATGRFPPMAQ
jgi:apolipoprotein N-acyltransferase